MRRRIPLLSEERDHVNTVMIIAGNFIDFVRDCFYANAFFLMGVKYCIFLNNGP